MRSGEGEEHSKDRAQREGAGARCEDAVCLSALRSGARAASLPAYSWQGGAARPRER